ncbi:hypothetical protein LZ31DRAFT_273223 [Colletotrichum somersetense]|nr:hypothetical protein LZ31DRAFT_273223 [Colletotrichum somersetense]
MREFFFFFFCGSSLFLLLNRRSTSNLFFFFFPGGFAQADSPGFRGPAVVADGGYTVEASRPFRVPGIIIKSKSFNERRRRVVSPCSKEGGGNGRIDGDGTGKSEVGNKRSWNAGNKQAIALGGGGAL